jgi:hypothetical protein
MTNANDSFVIDMLAFVGQYISRAGTVALVWETLDLEKLLSFHF